MCVEGGGGYIIKGKRWCVRDKHVFFVAIEENEKDGGSMWTKIYCKKYGV